MGTQAQTELISLPLFLGLLGILISWAAAVPAPRKPELSTVGLAAGLLAGFALFAIVRGYPHDWLLPVGGLAAGLGICAALRVRLPRGFVVYPLGAALGAAAGALWIAIIGL